MTEDVEILIAKHFSGNISEEEQRHLNKWIEAETKNSEEFNRLKNLWDHSLNLARESVINVDEAWEEFKLLADSQPDRQFKPQKFSTLKIAAAIALIICSLIIIKLFIPQFTNTAPEKALVSAPPKNEPVIKVEKPIMISISTADSAKEFFLPDNSRVHLYKNSTLSYPASFNNSERTTYLTGEAFFDVMHSDIPFTTFCQNTRIKDLGTSFNIKGYEKDNEVEVFVVTGKVEFSDEKKPSSKNIILSQNEWGSFDKEHDYISKTKNIKKDIKKREKTTFIQKIKKWIKNLKKKKK
jgi:transmembrane sensor